MRDILAEVNEALCALHVLHFGRTAGVSHVVHSAGIEK